MQNSQLRQRDGTLIYNKTNQFEFYLSQDSSNLWFGFIPKSYSLVIAAFYMALFIIRPWDILFPWLGEIHFERSYLIFMLVVVFLGGSKSIKLDSITMAVFFFLCALLISTVFSQNPLRSWEEVYPFISIILFYFILLKVVKTPYDLMFLFIIYIVTMMLYLMKSQWEFFIHGAHVYRQGVARMRGIESAFGGPNWLAGSIALSLPVLQLLWSVRKELTANWSSFLKRWFPRILIIYSYLSVSSILLTNSRSGMIIFLVFILLISLRGKGLSKKMLYLFLSLFFLIILWNLAPGASKGRFMTMIDQKDAPKGAFDSALGRVAGFNAGIHAFNEYTSTGIGVGNLKEYRVKFVDGIPEEAHNLAGQLLGEVGVVGLIAFFLFTISIFRTVKRIRLVDGKRDINYRIALTYSNVLILLFLEGIFNHNLLRYNWIWIAAFSSITYDLVESYKNIIKLDKSY